MVIYRKVRGGKVISEGGAWHLRIVTRCCRSNRFCQNGGENMLWMDWWKLKWTLLFADKTLIATERRKQVEESLERRNQCQ